MENHLSCELAYQALNWLENNQQDDGLELNPETNLETNLGANLEPGLIPRQRKLLVIADGVGRSHELLRQMNFFLGDKSMQHKDDILLIPDNQVLAYDSFSPDPHTTSKRINAFYKLLNGNYKVAVVSIGSLLRLTPPPSYFIGQGLNVQRGQEINRSEFISNLMNSGYNQCNHVAQPGDMAVRGAIVDVFPAAADCPYRLEWLDDNIESLRSFNVKDQTSIEQLEHIKILPSTEFPVHEDSVAKFIDAWQSNFSGAARRHPVYYDLKRGIIPAGIESFLPLFFDASLGCVFDYLSGEDTDSGATTKGYDILYPPQIKTQAGILLSEAKSRWQDLGGEEAVLMPPSSLFLDEEQLESILSAKNNLYVPQTESSPADIYDVSIDIGHSDRSEILNKFSKFVDGYDKKILLCLTSAKRYELLKDWLKLASLDYQEINSWAEFQDASSSTSSKQNIYMAKGNINHGLIAKNWAMLCETELFGNVVIDTTIASPEDSSILSLADKGTFTPGELVVHKEFGVGRFLSLENRSYGDYSGDFIVIEYAESTKLYLPVHNLHFLSSYSALPGAEHPLDKLGGKQWGNRRRKALSKIEDTAASLLKIYAEREQQKGLVFSKPDKGYEEFSLGFPYEETLGQSRAIADIIEDMTSSKKSDRLICGDVGFGKTEVAIRAVYLAVTSGYQVAILTPTTVLASQHINSFRDRFATTPFVIEGLSRLSGSSSDILSKLDSGKIDIIIGTHALLGKSVKFAKLGLVIIDEEHRFGVKQKEKLKSLHPQVDIISLSATPIPRTLNFALSGLRDISLLANPPPGRLPIKTYTGGYDDALVKEAIQRELMRDGQVYYVFNHVNYAESKREYLQEMFPDASIEVIHGQLDKQKLEEILRGFYHRQISILVCTSIIENGLDAPNANTIIIDEPELFGLSQLHQLRGRVGRRKRQAFAYLLTSYEGISNKRALKRIHAIKDNSDLGSGFNLATYDLELRGAGEMLGAEQSGFMQKLGLELYTQMLNEAVLSLSSASNKNDKATPTTSTTMTCDLDLAVSAFIPDDYIEDLMERVRIYKQLATGNREAVENIKKQMLDRYGSLPLYA
ncbi:MAG: transcription-repair coupling factor, partial [Candidatus Portiera sp.]|nr:transcription-repair coupling factor [Portiera sp.]